MIRTTLTNGVRVVSETMADSRSVTLGVWAGVGGRDEPDELAGASHFLEHLLFKGTATRTAREIAETVDGLGGEMNAYTAKEHTAYHVRLPAEDVDTGFALLSDVCTQPAFRPAEIDAERQVILEEILQSEDEPDDRVHSLCFEALFPGHPLGREVLGSTASIEAMGRPDIAGFFEKYYRPANLVVAAAGKLSHEQVVEAVVASFGSTEAGAVPHREAPGGGQVPLAVQHRRTEQTHLAIGWRAFHQGDDRRYPLAILNQVLGGGLSSRLFQEIREQRGLAYSVGSYSSLYTDAGALVVYASTSPKRLTEVRSLVDDVVASLVADGITEQELQVAQGYLRGSMVLGLEDSGSRMARLGASVVTRNHVTPLDEHLARVAAVTVADVAEVIAAVLDSTRSVAAVGPVRESSFS